ncbi:hypothetical protein D3C79_731730 [compost metagenome]
MQAFEADAHDRVEIGEHPEDQRGDAQGQALLHAQAVIALQHGAAALAQGFLVFAEADLLVHAIAMFADDQLMGIQHGARSGCGRGLAQYSRRWRGTADYLTSEGAGLPALVIQALPGVLVALASSRGKPAPTVVLCTPDLWELALPAIERVAVAIQAPPDVLAGLASSLASQLPQWMCVHPTCGSGLAPR